MAGDDDQQDKGAGGADDDELDETSLPDDAKRLLKHMGKVTRRELNSVLDERLRVEPGDGKEDRQDKQDQGGGGEGGQDTPGRSLAERLGFGG